MRLPRLTWRQIVGNPARSLLMAAGVAAGAAAMTAVALLIAGTSAGLRRTIDRLGADMMVVPRGEEVVRRFNDALVSGRPAMFYLGPEDVRGLASLSGIQQATGQVFVETLDNARCCAGKFFLVGFDPESDFLVRPWLADAGGADPFACEDAMVVGDRILLRLGRSATFYGKEFTVTGVLAPTGTGMDSTIFVPVARLREMVAGSADDAERELRIADGAVSAIFVKAAPGEDLIDLAERIEAVRPGVQVVLSSSVSSVASARLAGMNYALGASVAILWLMAVAFSGVVFSQMVREQQAEMGLLMARGARRSQVMRLVVGQSAALATGASLLGCALGATGVAAFSGPLARVLDAPDVLPPLVSAGALATSVTALVAVGSVAAALALAWPTLRKDPYEAIKQGAAT